MRVSACTRGCVCACNSEFSHRGQALGPSVFASCSRYLCAEVYVSACVSVCLAACVHAILAKRAVCACACASIIVFGE